MTKFYGIAAALLAAAVVACGDFGAEAQSGAVGGGVMLPGAPPYTGSRRVTILRVRPGMPRDPQETRPSDDQADQYKDWYRWMECQAATPYFHCDYTSQTCVRGLSDGFGTLVGVVLGSDRKTVLAHIFQRKDLIINYDTRLATIGGYAAPQLGLHENDGHVTGGMPAPPTASCTIAAEPPE